MTEMEKQAKLDRLSNLPWNVLDTILVNLPLRDAARTSVLSSKWRYKWIGLSQFVFDDKCFSSSLSDKAKWGEIMKIIDTVRLYHSGPVEKFKLAAYCFPNLCDLDQWIEFLAEKGIRELVLQDFTFMKRYKLPYCLFSCPQLSCLELYGCTFKLPSIFKGFHCLKSLQLAQVSITSDTLERLISNCPILEKLTLLDIDHLDFVRINHPNLKYLKIDSEFEDINLENSMHLATIDIRMIPKHGRAAAQDLEQSKPCDLVRIFGCMNDVERLTLSGCFLEFLAGDKVPERFPTVFHHLLFLDLKEVKLCSLKEVIASFAILNGCRNLEELVITVVQSIGCSPVVDFLKSLCVCGFFFDKLKVVKIRGMIGTRAEWEFIKLVLTASPLLETLMIVNYVDERIPESMLERVDRASENVKIMSLTL